VIVDGLRDCGIAGDWFEGAELFGHGMVIA
jgi:hypothetical protein